MMIESCIVGPGGLKKSLYILSRNLRDNGERRQEKKKASRYYVDRVGPKYYNKIK